MLTIDRDSSRVLLVGFSEFPKDADNLLPLPAVKNNITDFETMLLDPEIIGIPAENIKKVINEGTNAEVAQEIYLSAKAARDTFIFYYSGHGLIGNESPDLYLATSETSEDGADYTALQFEKVRQAVNASPAKKKILIIDCCFGGRALKEVMGPKKNLLRNEFDLKGTYAMASAPANKLAIAPEGARHTAFSGELLQTLRQGIDNKKDMLTLKDVFDHIRDQLQKDPKLPEPQHVTNLDPGDFVFAHNRRYELQQAVSQQIGELRDLVAGKFSDYDRQIRELKALASAKASELPHTKSGPAQSLGGSVTLVSSWHRVIYSLVASVGIFILIFYYLFETPYLESSESASYLYRKYYFLIVGAALILSLLINISAIGIFKRDIFSRFFGDMITPQGLLWSSVVGLITIGIFWVLVLGGPGARGAGLY